MKYLIVLGLFLSQYGFSQSVELEFGKISQEELDMKIYEKDPEAKAIILYDKGMSLFFDTNNGYNIRFIRHKRIKIFDKGESQYTEVEIPYFVDENGNAEAVQSIEAFTYSQVEGKVIQKRLDPTTIFVEKVSDRWYRKKFIFPDVRDGSVLEYRYVLETPFHFNLPSWTFQDRIPTLYSEYQVSMIPFYEYVFLVQGITKFDFQSSVADTEKRVLGGLTESYGQTIGSGVQFQDYVHRYVLKDVPAFKDESFISSINDYIIKMEFQLAKVNNPGGGTKEIISTWTALNEALLQNEDFGKYLKSCSKISKKIVSEEMNLVGLGDKEKAKNIIEYVKNNFEWNGYYSKYASQSAKDFFSSKSGNVADINLFMISMLLEAGIKADPIILSTRNHGKIPNDYPFDHFTNYVIALVQTEAPFLADGTEDLIPYARLPLRCNNEKGLIVDKSKEPKWVSLDNSIFSKQKTSLNIKIDSVTMDVVAFVSIQKTEYESYLARLNFRDNDLKIKEHYSDKIGEIKMSKTMGYSRFDVPYSMHFETKPEIEVLGNNLVLKPFLNLPLPVNNLTQETRSYPVDFVYPWEAEFESKLEIPSNFSVTNLPKKYIHSDDLADINLSYELDHRILIVKGNYKFKKASYHSGEYSMIKSYLDQIVKQFNAPLVLEKSH